jgi:elongation factor 3
MPEIVPKVTEALGNARQGVKDAAAAAMTACMQCVNNKDLEQFIPMLIDTMQNPIKVPDCVHKLAATTFVQVSSWAYVLQGQPGPALSFVRIHGGRVMLVY